MGNSLIKKYPDAEFIASIFSNYKLRGERTISEHLTIDNIPLFEALLPEMVVYKIPTYNGKFSFRNYIFNLFKMLLKLLLRNFIGMFKISWWNKKNLLPENSLVFLVFNKLMLSQIVNPILRNFKHENNLVAIVDSNYSFDNTHIRIIDSHNLSTFKSIRLIFRLIKTKNLILKDLPGLHKSLHCFSTLEIRDFINWLFYERIFALTHEVIFANNLFTNAKCKCIISTDIADPKARIFSIAAKNNKIKSLQIQYGLIDESSHEYRFPIFDKIAVFGENSKIELLKHGFKDDWIVITGSIKYDSNNYLNRQNLHSRFNIEKNKTIVLLASTYFIKGYESAKLIADQVILDIFNIVQDNDDLVLIIKPHPILNSERHLRHMSKKFSKIYFAKPNEDIVGLIGSCDVFINFGSTSNIDGILANKLVINPVYDSWKEPNNLLSTGLILSPSNYSELESCIKMALSNESIIKYKKANSSKMQEFVNKNIHKFDNNNFQRIIKLINL